MSPTAAAQRTPAVAFSLLATVIHCHITIRQPPVDPIWPEQVFGHPETARSIVLPETHHDGIFSPSRVIAAAVGFLSPRSRAHRAAAGGRGQRAGVRAARRVRVSSATLSLPWVSPTAFLLPLHCLFHLCTRRVSLPLRHCLQVHVLVVAGLVTLVALSLPVLLTLHCLFHWPFAAFFLKTNQQKNACRRFARRSPGLR